MDLRVDELVKSYRSRVVVDHLSLRVSPGEIVGLLGPNGAGKTTTFYMVTGMIRPETGHVFLGDHEVTEEPMYRRSRLGIIYLPQEPSIFRRLSVRENLLIVLERFDLSEELCRQRIQEVLQEFRMDSLSDRNAATLSGGERRRLEIARALLLEPRFLLLDEPFAGMDPIAVKELQGILRRLQSRGIGILISDHNVRETLSVCDRAYLIHHGKILEEGGADVIVQSAKAREAYLGEGFRL
ncbi:MAG: LPS export ABC transporter ATP-binding protein [Deltaproteobacteria bacterium]|nr:LPS export ABC transporter ATP-binding protein [Deltaproteobacteria bacterium]